MHGLVVIEGMTLSGHPWIINEMNKLPYKVFQKKNSDFFRNVFSIRA